MPTRNLRYLRSALLGLPSGLLVGLFMLGVASAPIAQAHFGCPTASAINGTSGNDMIQGDGGANDSHDHVDAIDGLSGNDTIEGYSCKDTIFGSLGNDEIHGGFGPDDLYGGPGDDFAFAGGQGIFLGNGNDYAEGGTDQDSLHSNSNEPDDDVLKGNEGSSDYVYGADSDVRDTVSGGADNFDDCYITYHSGTGATDNTGAGCETVFPI